jgi:curved DNA-binding protein CbpA
MMAERDAYEVLQVHPKADQRIVQAAYRILAAEYHPDRDGSPLADRRMAELNTAYALVRSRDLREAYDKQREHERLVAASTPSVPAYASRPTSEKAPGATLDFGRYAGWTIDQLARHDPEYLRWLSRQSSGVQYRQRIAAALAKLPSTTVLRPEDREL